MKRIIIAPMLATLALAGCDPTTPMPTPDPQLTGTTTVPAPGPQTDPSHSTQPASDNPDSPPVTPGGDAAPAVTASNAFGFAFHREIMGAEGNLAYSPASISMALAMTYAGAKGDTADEMKKTLRFPAKADALHGGWASVISGWQGAEHVEISVANRLYGDKKYTFEAPYLALTKSRYGAPLLSVDFAGAPEAQRTLINDWVEKQTRDRIEDLIPAGGVSGDTRMALVNALYFKSQWATPFDTKRTADAAFAAPKGSVTVPMMTQTEHMSYAEVDGVKLAQRSYKNGDFATLFVLPEKADGLAELENKLDAKLFTSWTSALSGERVEMKLPRFEIEQKEPLELGGMLQKLGMSAAFQRGAADFTGITNPKNPEDRLFIEKVYHKAFIGMDEAGTEAAAATAVMMGRAGGMPSEPKAFHADRPFLFFIRDAVTGLVMFTGRVVDPSK